MPWTGEVKGEKHQVFVVMMFLALYGPKGRWKRIAVVLSGAILAVPATAFFWSYILPSPMTATEYGDMQIRAVTAAIVGYGAGLAVRWAKARRAQGIKRRR